MAKAIAKRSEIPVEKRWALEDLYATDTDWEEDYERVSAELTRIEQYRGHLGDGEDILLAYLDLEDSLSSQVEKLSMYAHMSSDVDTTNTEYQAMEMKARALYAKFWEAVAFASPEMMEIPQEKLAAFRQSSQRYRLYDRYFTLMERERKHTRSKEVEELLAGANEMAHAAGNIFGMFNNADVKFAQILDENGEEAQVTHGRYVGYLESTDRNVRKAAFASMYASYSQYINTLAAAYSANVKQAQFFAKARGYSSTRQMYTSMNNVPESVYDNLIETVHEGLPAMYHYVALRKKMLGVEELHMYDVYVPIVPDCRVSFSYEEAKATILEALKPMGETYLDAMKEGFDHRWIDACENEGKRSGAYCSGGTMVHPYVLMTWQGTMDNMFTLAHEMGHALHSYFSTQNQPHQTADYVIFVAEVASTCNEILLTRYLLNTTGDPVRRAYVINHFLDTIKGTLYRQTMFAEFEMKAHRMSEKGQALTSRSLSDMYYDLNQLYFGPDMVSDDAIRYEWARIPHFYSPFYVYQYATGVSAAAALSDRILKEGESAVRDYFRFLTGGGSKDPIDLLKDAGVDKSSPEPVRATVRLFDQMLGELEALLQTVPEG
ncbi:MAG: oligoendopeptidase F [Lachnospiraceae bacterium]|nr:oligoendopeptidase F [Lachnospiraceae bacterium]